MKDKTEKETAKKEALTIEDLIFHLQALDGKSVLTVSGQHDSLKITGTVAGIEGNTLILENVEVKTN